MKSLLLTAVAGIALTGSAVACPSRTGTTAQADSPTTPATIVAADPVQVAQASPGQSLPSQTVQDVTAGPDRGSARSLDPAAPVGQSGDDSLTGSTRDPSHAEAPTTPSDMGREDATRRAADRQAQGLDAASAEDAAERGTVGRDQAPAGRTSAEAPASAAGGIATTGGATNWKSANDSAAARTAGGAQGPDSPTSSGAGGADDRGMTTTATGDTPTTPTTASEAKDAASGRPGAITGGTTPQERAGATPDPDVALSPSGRAGQDAADPANLQRDGYGQTGTPGMPGTAGPGGISGGAATGGGTGSGG